jgi:hypothetical protein
MFFEVLCRKSSSRKFLWYTSIAPCRWVHLHHHQEKSLKKYFSLCIEDHYQEKFFDILCCSMWMGPSVSLSRIFFWSTLAVPCTLPPGYCIHSCLGA